MQGGEPPNLPNFFDSPIDLLSFLNFFPFIFLNLFLFDYSSF